MTVTYGHVNNEALVHTLRRCYWRNERAYVHWIEEEEMCALGTIIGVDAETAVLRVDDGGAVIPLLIADVTAVEPVGGALVRAREGVG